MLSTNHVHTDEKTDSILAPVREKSSRIKDTDTHTDIIMTLCPGAWPGGEHAELSETESPQEVKLII